MKSNDIKHIYEVYRALKIESEESRKKLRKLAELGRLGEDPPKSNKTPTTIRNNTAEEDCDA